MQELYSETLPYLEHQKSTSHLLVILLHKQLEKKHLQYSLVLRLGQRPSGCSERVWPCETRCTQHVL